MVAVELGGTRETGTGGAFGRWGLHGVGSPPPLGGVSSSALRWFKKKKRAPLPQHRAPGAHTAGLGGLGPLPGSWMPMEKVHEGLETRLPR